MSESLIHRRFEGHVRRQPDAIAIETETEQLSYAEFGRLADRLAVQLIGAGVKPDEPVGLCAERSIEAIIATLGILKAGGACFPIEPTRLDDQIRILAGGDRPPIILAQLQMMTRLSSSAATVIRLETATLPESASAPDVPVTGDNLAYLVPSSDANHATIGVEIVHHSVTRLIGDCDVIQFGPNETLPLLSPLTSIASLFEIWSALLHGGRLVVGPPAPISPKELGGFLLQHHVTTLQLPTLVAQWLIEERIDDLAELRHLIVTGDALATNHLAAVRKRYPKLQLLTCYSPGDAMPLACRHPITDISPDSLSLPIGRPIDGVFVAVLDDQGQPTVDATPGELCIGGSGLPRGYHNRPDLTAARFISHPFEPGIRLFKTGDRVSLHDDGVLEFIGRTNQQNAIRNAPNDHSAIEAA